MKDAPASAHPILLLLFFLLPCAYFIPRVSASVTTRASLVLSLVEQRTFQIDRYHYTTIDKAYYQGHYYSDKPPLPAFLGAPVFLFVRPFIPKQAQMHHVARILSLVVISIPSTLLLLSFFHYGISRGISPRQAFLTTCLYGFGTLAYPFSTLFYGHQLAAIFLWFSYLARERPWKGGVLASLAVASDFLAGLGWLVLLWIAFTRHRLKAWPFLVASLFGFALIFGYNWACFDHPLRFAYHHEAEAVFREGMRTGLFGVGLPSLYRMKEILFSPRGLIASSPHLLFAPLALYDAARARRLGDVLPPLIIFFLFLVANSGYYLPFAGSMIGPRLLVPALPFLSLLFFFAGKKTRLLSLVTGLYSVVTMFLITLVNPEIPDSDLLTDPFFQYTVPLFFTGNLSENLASLFSIQGHLSLLPLLVAEAVLFASIWKQTLSPKEPIPSRRT